MKISKFLNVFSQFQLGHLPTESQHANTLEWSIADLPRTLAALKEIDLELFSVLREKKKEKGVSASYMEDTNGK